MVGYPAYFVEAGSDPLILILSILIIIILVAISIFMIEMNCKNQKVKNLFYLGLLLQLGIVVVDHFIIAFPTIELDPRAFERSGWYSYLFDVNIGRGKYNYWLINPIYKLLKIRVAIIFSAINIIFTIMININMYKIFTYLKTEKKILIQVMTILVLSPISLIMKAGIQREAIIILFVSYSLKNFIYYTFNKHGINIILAFLTIGLASLFHSGVIFLSCGYLVYLISGKNSNKIYQYFILIIIFILFLIFKDSLLYKVGGGDVDKILAINNSTTLREAGSGYLKNLTTTSIEQIFLFLPLFMFYFLFSPTPDMMRGMLDIITFALNSSIYIHFIIYSWIIYKKIRKKLSYQEIRIIKALTVSLVFTIMVFSIGTRNAGTAMRHRDKILPFLAVCFIIIKNKDPNTRRLIKNDKSN